ncbi:MAG: N-acetyl-alpha-D-glucosaminyl L-malate synthase BshA [Acidobacteria bacterium]|nr:N-acetyl-alpha-D-glucosaminyl L-malate synthase BshA [Acidobacteriota bacterium]
MNVGIVCYASVGGSGVVAVELAKCLAARGHDAHVISSEPPFRLREPRPGVWFHRVEAPGYPLFREPQYLLALTNRIVELSRAHQLDIIHAHYAIPHAAAAYLARQILRMSHRTTRLPRTVTTLHGTDVTIVGSDPSYRETLAFCIDQSDGVTAVSESLRADTHRDMAVQREITVIYNFLDCEFYDRRPNAALRARLCPSGTCEKLVVHVSNFRPVKQVDAVVQIFARIRRKVRARLVLVGEGPESPKAAHEIRALNLERDVEMIGEANDVVGVLSIADLFLLPSLQESFGLAALEAMACGVPVVASRVGGLPELIVDGVSGSLHGPRDLDGMAQSAVDILTDAGKHQAMAAAARRMAVERFGADRIVPLYEACYERVLAGISGSS